MTQAPQLRQLGIGEILDVALKIVWRNLGTFLRIVVFIVLPVQIVAAIVQASAASRTTTTFDFGSGAGLQTNTQSDVWALVGAFLVVLLLTLLSSTLTSGACFRAVASAYLGEATSWLESLRFALSRALSLFWLTVLVGVFSALGLVLCVIPGIYIWVSCSVAVPVLLTEGHKGTKAIGRSRRLVKGYWWRAFGVVILGYLLSTILAAAISGVVVAVSSVQSGSDSFASLVLSVVAGTLSKLVTTPFVAAFISVLYFDLRVRKEAFDLQLLASRIGVEPPAGVLSVPAGLETTVDGGERPPFWPPPPGWKPGGDP